MERKETLSVNMHTKILVPASSYSLRDDSRLLIPFTSGGKIGFVNKDGIIAVEPQYTMYYGDCNDESDYIRVATDYLYGYKRSGDKVACYKRPIYGLLDSKGEIVFKPSFYRLAPNLQNKKMYTVQNMEFQYGVIDVDGTEIVPFGKYNWIDGFDKGLARVKIGTPNGLMDKGSKWGLIDETGKEILPVEYDEIWSFYGKDRFTAKVVKGDCSQNMILANLSCKSESHEANPNDLGEHDDYGTHYGEYAGTYAQDVEGYSDDVIDDAFEGDPDAYWNID